MNWLTPDRQLLLLRAGARVPTGIWWPVGQLVSSLLAIRPPKPLRQWERNATVACGQRPGLQLRRRAQWFWLRNTVGSLQLGHWSSRRINRAVRIDPAALARLRDLRSDRGLVIALPHMGSWDLAGAFACINGLPLTTVAERLPAGQFEYFSRLRARLGMHVYPYTEPNLIPTLVAAVRAGRVVCLVADRDFGRRGLSVGWPTPDGERELTIPAGPVLIAQQTGAALVGVGCWFEGGRLGIDISAPIAHAPGLAGARQMGQELVRYFAAQIRMHPADWHMMQRFFPREVV